MKFVRFGIHDGNYDFQSEKHQWAVPLSLGNKTVGLHSLHLILDSSKFKADDKIPNFLVAKSNLIEKSIINQTGILKMIPLHRQSNRDVFFYTYETINPGLFVL